MVRATSFCEDPRTVPVSGMLSEGDATGKAGREEGRKREKEGTRGRRDWKRDRDFNIFLSSLLLLFVDPCPRFF